MEHILPGSQDAYYDYTKIEDLRRKYMKINFFPHLAASMEELRKKQVLDMVKLLGFSEEKIKRVEEALAKYERVDEALEEIKKLSLGKPEATTTLQTTFLATTSMKVDTFKCSVIPNISFFTEQSYIATINYFAQNII